MDETPRRSIAHTFSPLPGQWESGLRSCSLAASNSPQIMQMLHAHPEEEVCNAECGFVSADGSIHQPRKDL